MTVSAIASPQDQNTAAQSKRYSAWIVCFSAALFFFYEFIQMQMFNSISTELMHDFAINAEQLGRLSATYFYADVVFLFPAGLLLDRFSTRWIILVAMLLCVIGTAAFAVAHNVWFAGICHFFAGIGNAFCFLSCIRLASRWFPARQMALVVGLIVTVAMTGGLVAQTPLTLLTAAIGWRYALLLNAGLGLAIMVLIFCFVSDYPPSYQQRHLQEQQQLHALGFWASIKMTLKNTQNWLFGLYTSLLNLPIMLLCALWGDLYLTQVHHLSKVDSANVISMIFAGTILGGPLLGAWSDKIALRRLPMLVGGLLSLLTILLIMYLPNLHFWGLAGLFLALGFFTSAQVLGYPAIAESNPKLLTTTPMGLAATLIMGGAAIFQPFFGSIMDSHWQGKMVEQARLYPPEAYHLAIMILPLAFIAALLMAWLGRETYCREQV